MQNEYKHTTKDGKQISLEMLSDDHLVNIIRWIERRAQEGITVCTGGWGSYSDDMWGDCEIYYDKEALELTRYDLYMQELRRRNKNIDKQQ